MPAATEGEACGKAECLPGNPPCTAMGCILRLFDCSGICLRQPPHPTQDQTVWERLLKHDIEHVRLKGSEVKMELPHAYRALQLLGSPSSKLFGWRTFKDAWRAHECLPCAMVAVMQPRWAKALWSTALPRLAPNAAGGLTCLKVRSGFAEKPSLDRILGRATDMPSLDARYLEIGSAWKRCAAVEGSCQLSAPTSDGLMARLNLSGALGCMRRVILQARSSSPAPRAFAVNNSSQSGISGSAYSPVPTRLHLFTDSPMLTSQLQAFGWPRAHSTPGIGVDPTNPYNSDGQNNSGVNHRKVALDFFLQGFCSCSITMMPSMYYDSGTLLAQVFAPSKAVKRACKHVKTVCPALTPS